ncbi:cytochrome P450 [Stipitochalara longipes BDJ]|nr:cytochrome P450 [Stipitochalara longipes BDJ]
MGLVTLLAGVFGTILGLWSWLSATVIVFSALVFYLFMRAIYNIHFHPLSKFPGPKIATVSNLFFVRTVVNGGGVKTMSALHEKYGEVVRWAPDELSFSSADAWKDIYMPHKAGEIFIKDPDWYLIDDTIRAPIITNIQDPEKHDEHKKILALAFAPKALNQQQDIVLKYVNMLMTAIESESRKGPINLVEFYNWVTSDVLGELAFSESFGSVENRKTNSWIATFLNVTKWGAWVTAIYRLSLWMWKYLHLAVPREMTEAALKHLELSKVKIFDRMARGNLETRDFCSYLFEIRDEI